MFPWSPSLDTTYCNVLGTDYRYDGTAWQVNTPSTQGITGIQGSNGLKGVTGLQGAIGVGSSNDGTNITFTDSKSVAQKVSPAAYGQVKSDSTVNYSVATKTWTRFTDWTGDSSSLINITNSSMIVKRGGDGCYYVGYSMPVMPDAATMTQVGIYIDGSRAFSTYNYFPNASKYFRYCAGKLFNLVKDSTVDLYVSHGSASTQNLTIGSGSFFFMNRVGRS